MSSRTRNELLTAAVDLFYRQGYDRTSLQAIVTAAGLSKGAFYHHFKGKEDLLRAIHDSFLDEELSRAEAVLAESKTGEQALRGLIRELLETVELYQERISIFLRERHVMSGSELESVRAKRDRFEGLVTTVIRNAMSSGEFSRHGDPLVISFGVMGMCAWAHEWYRPGGPRTIREIADSYADMVLSGLVAR